MESGGVSARRILEQLAAHADEPPLTVSVAGQQLRLFLQSPSMIAAMLEDIRAARRRVWLETYIFADDVAGEAVAAALKERAEAGVDVRLLYDTFGSKTTPSYVFRRLRHAGARTHAYHSLAEALARLAPFRILNQRNHRKLLVVDDRVAYFGGMNVIVPSSTTGIMSRLEVGRSLGWRDVHVRLEGPQQSELAASFVRSWRLARRQRVPKRSRDYRLGVLVPGEESIQFFDTGPGRHYTTVARVLGRLLQEARQTAYLSIAYFLPLGRMLRLLLDAANRGVVLHVIVPGISNHPVVQWATRHLYGQLLRAGMVLHERQSRMVHSKVMLVDDQTTMIGSANLDPRSLWLNLEFLAVIRSRPLAEVMRQVVEHDIHFSRPVTLEEILKRPWWQKVIDRVAWAVRGWL